MPSSRSQGIDLARGVAVLLMIETHAYDGWVDQAGKQTFAYFVTRVLSNIPAALFLLLAGVGLALAGHRALRKGGEQALLATCKGLTRRSLSIVGYGYLLSLAYALIEGRAALHRETLLRADILHCIGLSIAVCTWLLVSQMGQGNTARLGGVGVRALLLSLSAILVSLLWKRLLPSGGAALPDLAKVPLALLVDVAPYTRFPLFPLVAYCALGVAFGDLVVQRGLLAQSTAQHLGRFALFCGLAVGFTWLTTWTVQLLGGTLSRSHPALLWNVGSGAARALAVIFGCLAVDRLGLSPSGLVLLGRHSLLAYAFHIPLCYGKIPSVLGLSHRLSMGAATALVVGLSLLTWAVIRGREALKASPRP